MWKTTYGEGTGLDLSLSFDIVVKGHGGTIELLETDETCVAGFRIMIPIK